MINQQIFQTNSATGGRIFSNSTSLLSTLTGLMRIFGLDGVEERSEPSAIQARFSELYEKHVKRIYTYHYLKTCNIHDAEDLTSQTFLEAFESLDRYQEEGRFLAWLYSIARRRNADFYRKKKPLFPLIFLDKIPDKNDSPEVTIQSKIQLDQIKEGLRKIGAEKAEALILRVFCQVEAEEVGQVMGKSAAAVRMMVYRGLKELRTLLVETQESK